MFNRFVFTLAILSFCSIGHAALSEAQRKELFKQVEEFCRFSTNETIVIKHEGSLDAGASFKIFGIDGQGKMTKEVHKNLTQLFKEFRSDPTICRFEMIKTLEPFFEKKK